MRETLHDNIKRYIQQRNRRKKTAVLLSLLAVFTVIGVYSWMLVPAVSMVGADFNVSAETVRTAFGKTLQLRVDASADADEKAEEIVFLLSAQSTGGGLAHTYQFDSEGVCKIPTDNGGTIALHREWSRDGSANARDYWFTLRPGESAGFLLDCVSDTALYDESELAAAPAEVTTAEVQTEDTAVTEPTQAQEQETEAATEAAEVTAKSRVQLRQLKTTEKGKPQKLELDYVAAQTLDKAWKQLNDKNSEADLTLIWMQASALPSEGEPVLQAKADNGLVVTLSGPASSFPADVSLLDLSIDTPSAQEKALPSLDKALSQVGVESQGQQLFSLNLTQEGEAAELTGPVTVTIEGIAADSMTPILYEFDEDLAQQPQEVQTELQKDGSLVAETNSISTYAVVLASSQLGVIPSGSYAWVLPTAQKPLGDAAKFNLFTFGSVSNIPDVEGNAAIGGNVDFSYRGFNASTQKGLGASTSGIVVAKNPPPAIIFNGTTVNLGSSGRFATYDNMTDNNIWINPNLTNTQRKNIGYYRYDDNSASELSEFVDIDTYFAQMRSALLTQNANLSNAAANGTVTPQNNNLTFTGTDSVMNVFTVSADTLLTNSGDWYINVPTTSNVLINVTGASSIEFTPQTPESVTINGSQKDKKSAEYISLAGRTLWNFAPNITKVTVKNGGNMLIGSVLAPKADFDVAGVNAGFNGTLVANSLAGSADYNWTGFECHHYPSTFEYSGASIPTTVNVSVSKVWADGTAPSGATVTFELRNNGTLQNTITLPTSGGAWNTTLNGLPEGEYTLVETNGPSGYSSTIEKTIQADGTQAFTVTNTKLSTGNLTLKVKKTWGDTSGVPAGVTFALMANGKRFEPDQTLTLTAAGNWEGSFTNLPEKDENGNIIAYSVYELPVAGWTPSVEVTTIASQDAQWVNVPTSTSSLVPGTVYRFVSGAQALAWADGTSNNLTAAALNDADEAQQWTYVQSGNSYYLQNKKAPTRYIYLTGSGVTAPVYGSNRSAISLSWSNGTARIYNGSNYIRMTTTAVSRGSSSTATYFTPQTFSPAVAPRLEFNVTNNKITSPDAELSFPHDKQIDSLADGVVNPDTSLAGTDLYRLYLDARTKGHPIDLVLVVDRSGSMQYSTTTDSVVAGSLRRDQAVQNLLNGANGEDGFVKRFLGLNEQNNLSIVWFGGDYYGNGALTGTGANDRYFNTCMESGVVKAWTQDQNYKVTVNDAPTAANNNTADNITYRSANGTNYVAGMWEAADMLRSNTAIANNGHKKMVVFLTDGAPTFYVKTAQNATNGTVATYQQYLAWKSAGKPSTLYRTGQGSSPSTNDKNATNTAINDFKAQNPGVILSSIMFAPTTQDTSVLANMTNNGGTMTHTQGDTSLSTVFANIIAALTFSKNFSITDNLSQYVEWYAPQPDLKVLRTNLLTGAQDVLWQSTGPASAGTIGAPTAKNTVVQDGVSLSVLESVTYNPSTSASSTGMVQILFNQEYKVDIQNKYTLSFNVKTTPTAYRDFSDNRQNGDATGYNGIKGDANTDYAYNTTSSGKPGFHANREAIIKYRYDGLFYEEPYDHPVIQVAGVDLVIRKTDITGNKLLPGAAFDLYQKAAQGDAGAVLIPGASGVYGIKKNGPPLVIGTDGTYRFDALLAGEYYLVETAAPSGYNLLQAPIGFHLQASSLTVIGNDGMAEADGTTADGALILQVKNTDGYTLPATGGSGVWLNLGVGILLTATAAILLILKKRRR